MALQYPPRAGAVLMCTFPDSFAPPEMIKTRPVVVINPQLPGRLDLVAVVPLSTTPPNPVCNHHCQIPIASMPPCMQAKATEVWAKCDMLYTFSLQRLDRFKAGRERGTGKRLFESGQLSGDQLDAVRRCAASALGIRAALFNIQ